MHAAGGTTMHAAKLTSSGNESPGLLELAGLPEASLSQHEQIHAESYGSPKREEPDIFSGRTRWWAPEADSLQHNQRAIRDRAREQPDAQRVKKPVHRFTHLSLRQFDSKADDTRTAVSAATLLT